MADHFDSDGFSREFPDNLTLSIYTAGGMFTYRELAMNLYLKESIWRQSAGKFILVLPQSEQPEEFEHPDVSVRIRNTDLWHVMRTDLLLAQFDGLELDAGTVAEFMMAKFLGKPTVILRSDSRRMTNDSFDEPYNLMVKHYPRTKVIHIDSLFDYLDRWEKEKDQLRTRESFESLLELEKRTIDDGIEYLTQEILAAFDEVLRIPSPYPPEFRKMIYHAARHMPGSGFEDLVTEQGLKKLLETLEVHGTL
jgi:nucleoside 2-deoxyribosyltransferase